MDDEMRMFLHAAFQYLQLLQRSLQEVQIVTFALQKTVRELGPEAQTLYAKHYQAVLQGPLKQQGDLVFEDLERLLSRLNGEKPN
jgi:hypothetical protein